MKYVSVTSVRLPPGHPCPWKLGIILCLEGTSVTCVATRQAINASGKYIW